MIRLRMILGTNTLSICLLLYVDHEFSISEDIGIIHCNKALNPVHPSIASSLLLCQPPGSYRLRGEDLAAKLFCYLSFGAGVNHFPVDAEWLGNIGGGRQSFVKSDQALLGFIQG